MENQNLCPICLQQIALKGGKPLIIPGCCGKMFHQECLQAIASLQKRCPCCCAVIQIPQFQSKASASAGFDAPGPQLQEAGDAHEDPAAAPVSSKTSQAGQLAEIEVTDRLQIKVTLEFPGMGTSAKPSLLVHLGMSYTVADTQASSVVKAPLDVLCILDTSGSMAGEKMENLRRAMSFVIDNLGGQDRLSIVNFNSAPFIVHGFLRMDAVKKANSKMCLFQLVASGGTNILLGLQQGWSILENRTSKSPSACVFLLTDGQDKGNQPTKLALAAQMKRAGMSLFVFGFGADHDSAHMAAIAEAGEGTFVYIENNNDVVEAFGGAIGAQQGPKLKNISLQINMSSPNLTINRVMSGRYPSIIGEDQQSVSVSFINLFAGEVRDVLLDVNVPAAEATDCYPLLVASTTFCTEENEEEKTSEEIVYTICRVNDSELDLSMERNLLVDTQMMRVQGTAAIEQALQWADGGDFDKAKRILEGAISKISSSSSCKAGILLIQTLREELQDALISIRSRTAYYQGGRAMMSDCFSGHSANRRVYTRADKTPMYQNRFSMVFQDAARTTSLPHQDKFTGTKSDRNDTQDIDIIGAT